MDVEDPDEERLRNDGRIAAAAKKTLESAIEHFFLFEQDTLPTALHGSYICEFTIKRAIDEAMFCEATAKVIPSDVLDEQLQLYRRKYPERVSGGTVNAKMFGNAVEQLYMNFVQNTMLPEDAMKRCVDRMMVESVGEARVQGFREKTVKLFHHFEELSEFLVACPTDSGTEVQALHIDMYLRTLQCRRDVEKKVSLMLRSTYKFQSMVIALLGSEECSNKPAILTAVKTELEKEAVGGAESDKWALAQLLFFGMKSEWVSRALSSTMDVTEGPSFLKIFVECIDDLSKEAAFVEKNSSEYCWELPKDCGFSFTDIKALLTNLLKEGNMQKAELNSKIKHILSLQQVKNSLFWEDLEF
jgi:hypothetical protein